MVAIIITYVFSGSLILALVAVASLWLTRKQPAAEVHLSEAQAELALAQADDARTHTKKTYGEIFDEMHERVGSLVEELNQMEKRLKAKDAEKAMLEAQVARARAQGFLDRDEKGGTGPNPAA